jgi:hypothetical protein
MDLEIMYIIQPYSISHEITVAYYMRSFPSATIKRQ